MYVCIVVFLLPPTAFSFRKDCYWLFHCIQTVNIQIMSTQKWRRVKSRCSVFIPWVLITGSIWHNTKVYSSVWLWKVRIYVNKQRCLTWHLKATGILWRPAVKSGGWVNIKLTHFSVTFINHTHWVFFAVYPQFRSSKSEWVIARWNHWGRYSSMDSFRPK